MIGARCINCEWLVWLLLSGWTGLSWAASNPCDQDAYREFDFWVGAWRVELPDGRAAGRNRIEYEQQGCVLVERWHGVQGGTGLSMNFYEPTSQRWRQLWVSPGTAIDIAGGLVDGSMVLEGTITYLSGPERYPFRGTWTPAADGTVRQTFEEAREAGLWSVWFDAVYRPEEPAAE